MSPSGDYRDEMSRGELTDSNIERLLRRDASNVSADDLQLFIASLSAPKEPPHDVPTMATALAATARANRPEKTRRSFRRLATLASAGVLVMALGSVALASDSSVPGDALYGVDRALEVVGLGNGGVDERIVEFDVLIAGGRDDEAYALLAEVIETEDGTASERAQLHLELAATKTEASAESAQVKVAALQEFIEQNRGRDGLNGKDFGEGLAAIARSDEPVGETRPVDTVEPAEQPSNSAETPGQLESDTGTQPDEQPGNSSNAPGQQEDNTREDSSESGDQPRDQPGNSANAPGQQKDKGDQSNLSGGGQAEDQPGNSANAPGQQKDKKNGN